LILRESSKFGAIRCQILRLKCTEVDFPGALSQTPLRKLTALLQTPRLYLRRPTSRGRKGVEGGEGRSKGKERGMDVPDQCQIVSYAPDVFRFSLFCDYIRACVCIGQRHSSTWLPVSVY